MWLFRTYLSWAPIFARLVLGVIFFAHGAQKLLGLFGGPGMSKTIQFFAQEGIPPFLAVVAILTEFFGGVALILGFLTRIAAIGLALSLLIWGAGNLSIDQVIGGSGDSKR